MTGYVGREPVPDIGTYTVQLILPFSLRSWIQGTWNLTWPEDKVDDLGWEGARIYVVFNYVMPSVRFIHSNYVVWAMNVKSSARVFPESSFGPLKSECRHPLSRLRNQTLSETPMTEISKFNQYFRTVVGIMSDETYKSGKWDPTSLTEKHIQKSDDSYKNCRKIWGSCSESQSQPFLKLQRFTIDLIIHIWIVDAESYSLRFLNVKVGAENA